jgi:hypothetical protein
MSYAILAVNYTCHDDRVAGTDTVGSLESAYPTQRLTVFSRYA